jgi:integrase
MKEPAFPLKFGRHEQVSIYMVKKLCRGRSYTYYTVSFYHCGKQRRHSFSSLTDARTEAAACVARLANGEVTVVELASDAAAAYRKAMKLVEPCETSLQSAAQQFAEAHRIVAPCGTSIVTAVSQFAEAHRILDGIPLIDAARLAAKMNKSVNHRVTVAEVAAEMLTDRKANGVGIHHLRVLEAMLRRIKDKFGQRFIGAVDGPSVKQFLNELSFKGQSVTPRTRNNYRQVFGQLFNFAQFHKQLSRGHDSVDHIAEYKETPKATEIYTPREIELLLATALDYRPYRDLVPFLAIGAFAGIRHEEIKRLDWKDISLAEGYITVQAGKAKTVSRRVVPVASNLAAWLSEFRRDFGPVCQRRNTSNALFRLIAASGLADRGFRWKRNALRHSFVSYRLAEINDAARVAKEAGNSEGMIHRHYNQLVTAEAAKAWFDVRPPVPGNVVQLGLFDYRNTHGTIGSVGE